VKLYAVAIATLACSSSEPANPIDGGTDAAPCLTRITYGSRWIRPDDHPAPDDVVPGLVEWDGICTSDGPNSYATLSNGWKPYFIGTSGCELALDPSSSCGAAAGCSTRVTYGATWKQPADHPARFDDIPGRVFWDGTCRDGGADSFGELSNGWTPYFTGAASCALAFRWQGCGGLYANPVMPVGCADPGVVRDGDSYVMTCTSGGAPDAFPLYRSSDLVDWSPAGHVLPAAARPAWATGDFWAPEIHRIGTQWVAYFSARHTNGRFAIGAATAASPTGPYLAAQAPIVIDPDVGLIDASAFVANGTAYLMWKEDGNAQGQPTPIRAAALGTDGLSITGPIATLVTNDRAWEDNLVEAPFVVARDGMFYLFYSGNAYYDGRYAVGVARASQPLGPYEKRPDPILVTGGPWVGPGHCSVVGGPGGDDVMVYHAWREGMVNGPGDERYPLVDQIVWRDGWPVVPASPSSTSRPKL
jgi:GH43 family beta-xylosidase